MKSQNLTRLILLGILNEFKKPKHGYEIKKIVNEWAIGEFTDISYGSIYYNLEKMENEELIVGKTIKNSERPEKRLYTITKKGRTEFLKLLKKNYFEIQPIRYPFDVGVLFMPALAKEDVLKAFNKRIEFIENGLRTHRGIMDMLKKKIPFFALSIMEHHFLHWESEKKWLLNLKSEVEKRETLEDKINNYST